MTFNSDGSSTDVQRIHDTLAQDGDTIIIPPGSFTWSQTVRTTKNIKILGAGKTQTNLTSTANPPSLFSASCTNGGLPVIEFGNFKVMAGSVPDYTGSQGCITLSVISNTSNFRIHDIDFTNGLHIRPICFFGAAWGVIDHCDFEMWHWVGGIDIRHSNWKGTGDYGDNSWADTPNFGTEQFIFLEDNSFKYYSGATFIDGDGGMRVVIRHNNIYASEGGNHGTETGQRYRSGRVFEFYNNTVDGGPSGVLPTGSTNNRNWVFYVRGGTGVLWGNSLDRYDRILNMDEYRLWFAATPWGQADGTNPWDKNNAGNPFVTGTATSGSGLTMTDTSKNWTTNQWRGYSLRNLATGKASSISSNTSNTINFDSNPQGAPMSFSSGQSYDIRKVDIVLDQPGRGKGNMININQPAWPNEVLEPIRVWGNTFGQNWGNQNGLAKITAIYNLSSGVDWFYSDDNSAALPGYTPFVYPHPLVTGEPPPPPPEMNITLTWTDNSNNEDGFKVERGTDGVNFSQIDQVAANITTYVDTTVLPNTQYFYRVRAYNVAGNSAYSNVANATTGQVAPQAPTNLVATAH